MEPLEDPSPDLARRKALTVSPEREHIVRFYEKSAEVVDAAGRFLESGLGAGEAAIVVASASHRDALERRLRTAGFDLAAERASGRFQSLDATKAIAKFSTKRGRGLEESRFLDLFGGLIKRAAEKAPRGRVLVFGEMVAVLWSAGKRNAAIRLEQFWNTLAARHRFSLFCAYPIGDFGDSAHSEAFRRVCDEHSRVLPAGGAAGLSPADDRQRVIAELQQQSKALEFEVARRKRTERELRRRERELSRAGRRKDEFLAMLGHELRNPLSPIVTSLELLHRRRDPGTIDRLLEIIERQTRRLTRLVDDLLDISRITRGTIPLLEETVELEPLVARAVEQAAASIGEQGHRLETDLPPRPVWLRADPARIEQVLADLLGNASKYMDPGGRIRLSARCDGADLTLSVSDTGFGLSAELRPKVFDLFFRSATSSSRAPGGVRIGLTLVRRITELHGGTVEARSDGPGCGSEFLVRLPGRLRATPSAPPRAPADAAGAEAPNASNGRRKILVVDDNSDVAEGLADLLRALGHDVAIARDGAGAISEAGRRRPDVVFLDISMPGLDGHQVARRMRSVPGLRSSLLIAVTGFGQESDRQLSREAGFDYHLVKPVDVDRLKGLLEEAC